MPSKISPATLLEVILLFSDIPDEKPIVRGASEKYHPGDLVRVNCTSAKSKPAANLKWFINGKPVSNYLYNLDIVLSTTDVFYVYLMYKVT